MAQFHTRTGSLVTLSNDNKTAQRNMPQQEFNNGVVLSAEPLHDNQLFEVRIDSKLNSWSGSIEIGVTTSDPSGLSFPTSASGFRDGTWVMSGSSVLKDGHATIEEYGPDLDQLIEGDRVGVMRTTNGALHFFVNGNDLGPADTRVPSRLFAIVDMYGKCSQVTIIGDLNRDKVISNEITNEAIAEATYMHSNERLLFHEHCGTLVKLTSNRRAAERRKPLDEFNNGVVMTNRPINDDEMFEIRLDRLVDKWSGSIEVGVTTHNPSTLAFPATMTNMRSGTIMMSGCGILTNGKGTQREYGDYNLDELAEGDRIGLMRLSNGSLHYYINGVDQGIAEQRCPQPIWGVVDLYGMAVKVTILDRSDPSYVEHEARARRYHNTSMTTSGDTLEAEESDHESEKLLFHPHCGYHAAVVNGQRTAHRPNAVDEFNHGVVLTNRMLRVGELFEVRLEKKVDKWAGSVDIGVTTHAPHTLEFPSTMTNIRSGTWIMTGNGVMHNGTTVLDEYGHNLDQIQVGDHVGVRRYENGDLHFVINNVDQGLAATNVPASIYGIIDLYGQACQVSIVDQSDSVSYSRHPTTHAMNDSIVSLSTSSSDELCFDHRHGKNAIITSAGKTALRPNAHAEFNDAIVMTNRPLRDNELFELTVENMVSRWSGSIEAGVSLMRPDEIDFPNTMTDLEYDTWMLSGSGVMYNGTIMRNGYDLDLDNLTTGSRIGMMRKSDGTLHFFLDGSDMGVAYADIPPGVYGMIDLYGQCSQVTITNGRPVRPTNTDNNLTVADTDTSSASQPTAGATHRFSKCCAQNVSLENNNSTARRTRHFNHGVVFSADPLRSNEMFEVQIDELSTQWGDGLHIGVTALVVCDSSPPSIVPISAVSITTKPTWVLCGSEVRYNGHVIRENYTPSLDRLQVGNRVGIKITSEGVLHLYINGDDMGPAAYHIPRNVFAVVDLYGQVKAISAVSTPVSVDTNVSVSQASNVVQDSNDAEPAAAADDDADADAAANDTVTTAGNDTVTTAADTTMQQHNTADTTTHQHNNDQPLHQQHNEVTNEPPSHNNTNNIEVDADQDVVDICEYEFDNNHSKNVELLNNRKTARRVASYNQGIVMSHQPLSRGKIYKVRIDEISSEWTSSLSIGVLATNVEKLSLPVAAVNIVKPCWVVQGNSVFHSSVKMSDRYGVNLDTLTAGTVLGVCVEHDNSLHLYVNDIDQGVAARNLPSLCYAVVDLYGQCRQVSIWDDSQQSPTNSCSEYREKADLEDVTKEKLVTFNDSSSKQCTYYNLCTRLKHLLALPDGYFLSGQSRCYCESCYKTRLDEAYLKKGDPPKDYAVPVGWCRYPIRLTNKAENQHVSEKWHVAFYGTSGAAIREILDTGDLLKSVESGGGYSLMAEPVCVEEKNKPEERAQLNQVTLSPTIKYAGHHMFASRYDFQDPASNKLHTGRFVLQVFCRPGSYKISGQSLSGAEPQIVDPLFNSTELEWSTKERGSIVLAALMVKVD